MRKQPDAHETCTKDCLLKPMFTPLGLGSADMRDRPSHPGWVAGRGSTILRSATTLVDDFPTSQTGVLSQTMKVNFPDE